MNNSTVVKKKRGARLGAFTHEGAEYRAVCRGGVVTFRRWHGRKVVQATLGELYSLAMGQRLLGI